MTSKLKPRDFRLSVWIGASGTWDETIKMVKMCEELGFYALYLPDEFVMPYDYNIPWLEAWKLLAGIGAVTEKIRIGAMVTTIIYRNPALTAKEITTVDHISNGRVELALGTGYKGSAGHSMTGVEEWEPKERVDRFEEFVQIVDTMLTNKVTNFEGKYYSAKNTHMIPQPIQKPRPPLTIGAHGPRMLRITAKYADVWNSFLGLHLSVEDSLKITAERNITLDKHAIKFGRDPDEIGRSLTMGWTPEKIYASIGAFEDYIYKFCETGINEFIVGYLPQEQQDKGEPLPIQLVNNQKMLETIALDFMPNFKNPSLKV